MVAEGEASREHRVEAAGAAGDIEDALAGVAAEVMVVGESGGLVARGLAGDADRADDAGVEQVAQGAVDGGEAEARDTPARQREDFARSQGAPGAVDGRADRAALSGSAFQGASPWRVRATDRGTAGRGGAPALEPGCRAGRGSERTGETAHRAGA